MQELVNVFQENNILILAIVIFILGLVLLGYLLTTITYNKKKVTSISKEKPKDKTLELEEMLSKMQQSLDKKDEMDNVTKYESDQEENAIISYQELLKAAKKDFNAIDVKEEDKIEILKPEILEIEKPKEEKKFKNSVFISPIYGTKGNDYMQPSSNVSSVDINISKDNLEYEDEMNEKFLEDLKKFRNNL